MRGPERLTYLFYRYYENACSPTEKEELFQLLLHPEYDALLRDLIDETWAQDIPSRLQDPHTADKILQYIILQQPPVLLPSVRPRQIFLRYAAAIFILLSVSCLAYYLYSAHTTVPAPPLANIPQPVTDQCLTLSDGSKVLLHKDAHIDFDPAFSGKTREVTLIG